MTPVEQGHGEPDFATHLPMSALTLRNNRSWQQDRHDSGKREELDEFKISATDCKRRLGVRPKRFKKGQKSLSVYQVQKGRPKA